MVEHPFHFKAICLPPNEQISITFPNANVINRTKVELVINSWMISDGCRVGRTTTMPKVYGACMIHSMT